MVDVPIVEEEGLGVVAQHDLGAVPADPADQLLPQREGWDEFAVAMTQEADPGDSEDPGGFRSSRSRTLARLFRVNFRSCVPEFPLVMRTKVTSQPAWAHFATVPAMVNSMSSGWA